MFLCMLFFASFFPFIFLGMQELLPPTSSASQPRAAAPACMFGWSPCEAGRRWARRAAVRGGRAYPVVRRGSVAPRGPAPCFCLVGGLGPRESARRPGGREGGAPAAHSWLQRHAPLRPVHAAGPEGVARPGLGGVAWDPERGVDLNSMHWFCLFQLPQIEADGSELNGRRFRVENGESLGEKEEVRTGRGERATRNAQRARIRRRFRRFCGPSSLSPERRRPTWLWRSAATAGTGGPPKPCPCRCVLFLWVRVSLSRPRKPNK